MVAGWFVERTEIEMSAQKPSHAVSNLTKHALSERSWESHSVGQTAVPSFNADLLSRPVRVRTEIQMWFETH
jgi:hypothetical protein